MFITFNKHILVCLLVVLTGMLMASCSDDDKDPTTDSVLAVAEFYPQEGNPGTEITILGASFGDYRLDVSGHIYFNGVEATKIVHYSDKRIVVMVPEGAGTGPITVEVAGNKVTTNESFTYVEPIDETALQITGFTPTEGYSSSEVTITGANFGNSVNGVTVHFNGVKADKIVSASGTEIKVIVPVNATTGPITVSTGMEETTSSGSFTCLAGAKVLSISPAHAWAGEEITITGEDFFNVGAENISVSFRGGVATATSASATEIKVKVPEDGATGSISVTFAGKQTVSGPLFQKYTLFQHDFNAPDNSSYAPFRASWAWDPNYIKIIDQSLEIYFNQEACTNDNRRERRGAEVVCDFCTVSEGWYGFKIFLPEGKFPKDVDGSIIAQIFNGGDANTWAGHLKIDQDKLVIAYRGSSAASAEKNATVGTLTWGKWMPIVMHFKAGRNNKGNIRVWLGDDIIESSPTLDTGGIGFGFGYWLDDNTLNGEETDDNPVADNLGGKWGLYVASGGDRTIRYDDLKILEGNPIGAFDIVKPEN